MGWSPAPPGGEAAGSTELPLEVIDIFLGCEDERASVIAEGAWN